MRPGGAEEGSRQEAERACRIVKPRPLFEEARQRASHQR